MKHRLVAFVTDIKASGHLVDLGEVAQPHVVRQLLLQLRHAHRHYRHHISVPVVDGLRGAQQRVAMLADSTGVVPLVGVCLRLTGLLATKVCTHSCSCKQWHGMTITTHLEQRGELHLCFAVPDLWKLPQLLEGVHIPVADLRGRQHRQWFSRATLQSRSLFHPLSAHNGKSQICQTASSAKVHSLNRTFRTCGLALRP